MLAKGWIGECGSQDARQCRGPGWEPASLSAPSARPPNSTALSLLTFQARREGVPTGLLAEAAWRPRREAPRFRTPGNAPKVPGNNDLLDDGMKEWVHFRSPPGGSTW